MLVAIPTWQGDVALLNRLLRWIRALDGTLKNHDALLAFDAATPTDKATEAIGIAEQIFRETRVFVTDKHYSGWPVAPTIMFHQIAKYVQEHWPQPFLLMEPDAVPIKPGWLDAMEAEYLQANVEAGHPDRNKFMGQIEDCSMPMMPPRVMSGVAIYPHDTATRIPSTLASGRPWNTDASNITVPHGTHTPLIRDLFGQLNLPPLFVESKTPTSPSHHFTLDWLPKEAVLFHRDKTHSLMPLLAKKLGIEWVQEPGWPNSEMAFFQLGRFGDLMLLFPAFKEWADRTGKPVLLFVAKEFASVTEGTSYIKAAPLPLHWFNDAGRGLDMAQRMKPGVVRVQLHGGGLKKSTPDTLPSYSISMWHRAGLDEADYRRLPLVFDNRSPEREAALIRKLRKTSKPIILNCFHGWTSPCQASWQLIPTMLRRFAERAEFINTHEVMAERIYDLLGLMDIAAGMITIDTAPLHLLAASKCPYIAIIRRDGQSGSIPKGNVALIVGYDEVLQRSKDIMDTMGGWLK